MRKKSEKRWAAHVQAKSDAMDLEHGVFQRESPRAIAKSILRSVKKSRRKKGTTLSSGISLMTYYANRAGSKLPATRKRKIQKAKEEYRRLVGRKSARK
jgi:hypothetical protein